MLRLNNPRFRPHTALLAVAIFFGSSTASFAQSAATASIGAGRERLPSSDTIRLTDEERNAILATNTVESAAVARGEREASPHGGRAVHGEMGVMIGSNGARGAYGVAEIPLGDSAGVVVSFESSRIGGTRR